jgi:hypothetical protein
VDSIVCPFCGKSYDPELFHSCPTKGPAREPVIHLIIGAGVGFFIWRRTQNTLIAVGAGIATAWFLQTKFGRALALLAILIAGVYLASVFDGR